ncbi:MAG: hypothetical protein L3J22_08285 [Xanthomonadales bacterium]|nr:hypothetical protein [Xanthomonadales bacterium]
MQHLSTPSVRTKNATKTALKPGVLLIIDGLGDLPVPELANKTPLEAAHTPVLDQLAANGLYGVVDPIAPGKIANTHSGTGMLIGLLPEQAEHLHRGPVEASGAGYVLAAGDVALRANFATLEQSSNGLVVSDRRAGRISSGTAELALALSNIDLGDGISTSIFPTDQHRAVLVLSGPGLSADISNTDPGDSGLPAAVAGCRGLSAAAEFTAEKINRFTQLAYQLLKEHPLNLARTKAGKFNANGIILRGAGAHFELDNAVKQHGVSAAVVSGCNTVLGLGRVFGFEAITDPRFTATVKTDLEAKISAVIDALSDYDMVFLHIKAPDLCSHDLRPLQKRDFLERMDTALKPLLNTGAVIALAADHSTDSNSGLHTADPVPSLIWQAGALDNKVEGFSFGESACYQGNMRRQTSHEFLLRVLALMGYSQSDSKSV